MTELDFVENFDALGGGFDTLELCFMDMFEEILAFVRGDPVPAR